MPSTLRSLWSAAWLVVPAAYALMSIVALLAYAADKHAARTRRRRIPEKTLHLIAFLGGWPGALVGQRLFRHKTRKQPFRAVFWLTVVANVALAALLLSACSASPARSCRPTHNDGVSPSYRAGAPRRSVVGHGHVLTGTVVSSRDCSPIAHARLELWPEYAGKGHPDSARATVFTDRLGRYRFECDRPEHIHMRISAPGYVTIGQNSYHPGAAAKGTFDVALEPDTP